MDGPDCGVVGNRRDRMERVPGFVCRIIPASGLRPRKTNATKQHEKDMQYAGKTCKQWTLRYPALGLPPNTITSCRSVLCGEPIGVCPKCGRKAEPVDSEPEPDNGYADEVPKDVIERCESHGPCEQKTIAPQSFDPRLHCELCRDPDVVERFGIRMAALLGK